MKHSHMYMCTVGAQTRIEILFCYLCSFVPWLRSDIGKMYLEMYTFTKLSKQESTNNEYFLKVYCTVVLSSACKFICQYSAGQKCPTFKSDFFAASVEKMGKLSKWWQFTFNLAFCNHLQSWPPFQCRINWHCSMRL